MFFTLFTQKCCSLSGDERLVERSGVFGSYRVLFCQGREEEHYQIELTKFPLDSEDGEAEVDSRSDAELVLGAKEVLLSSQDQLSDYFLSPRSWSFLE